MEPMVESEACELVSELTGGNTREVVSFGTEAGLFQRLGISAVVCGPGSSGEAHKADEFVAVEQLGQCLEGRRVWLPCLWFCGHRDQGESILRLCGLWS